MTKSKQQRIGSDTYLHLDNAELHIIPLKHSDNTIYSLGFKTYVENAHTGVMLFLTKNQMLQIRNTIKYFLLEEFDKKYADQTDWAKYCRNMVYAHFDTDISTWYVEAVEHLGDGWDQFKSIYDILEDVVMCLRDRYQSNDEGEE
jgi:hypothetical protein